jgi:hypothetical protein
MVPRVDRSRYLEAINSKGNMQRKLLFMFTKGVRKTHTAELCRDMKVQNRTFSKNSST